MIKVKRWKLGTIAGVCIVSILLYIFVTPYVAPWIAPPIVSADPDGDGLLNEQEKELGTDPLNADTDNDGVDDGDEYESGTSPVDFDTDGDGLGDGEEIQLGTDPKDIDSDNDGLEDGFEVSSFGTNPLLADTDLDKLPDKQEQDYGTNPLSSDTDEDGSSDYDELFVRHTDPLTPDVALMLTIRDVETGFYVKNVEVYIDGNKKGTTTQQGTILLDTIPVGTHRVSIAYTGYGTIEIGYMAIEKETTSQELTVDMPNPELLLSVSVEEWLSGILPPNEVGEATVTIANQGNLASKDTMALVMVYDVETEEVTDRDLIRLGSISTGEDTWKKSDVLDTSYWHNEYVLVVLFDGSKYLPERNLESMISAPGSVVYDLVQGVSNYVTEHPEVLGKIIGAAIKYFVGA